MVCTVDTYNGSVKVVVKKSINYLTNKPCISVSAAKNIGLMII